MDTLVIGATEATEIAEARRGIAAAHGRAPLLLYIIGGREAGIKGSRDQDLGAGVRIVECGLWIADRRLGDTPPRCTSGRAPALRGAEGIHGKACPTEPDALAREPCAAGDQTLARASGSDCRWPLLFGRADSRSRLPDRSFLTGRWLRSWRARFPSQPNPYRRRRRCRWGTWATSRSRSRRAGCRGRRGRCRRRCRGRLRTVRGFRGRGNRSRPAECRGQLGRFSRRR